MVSFAAFLRNHSGGIVSCSTCAINIHVSEGYAQSGFNKKPIEYWHYDCAMGAPSSGALMLGGF